MKKIYLIILFLTSVLIGVGIYFNYTPQVTNIGEAIPQLQVWTATSSPYSAITTRTSGQNIYIPYSSATTSLIAATTVCLTGDTCRTSWPSGGGGSGTVGTSSVPTLENLAYWTSAGTPSLLGSVATGTITCTGTASCGSGSYVVGNNLTITGSASGGGVGTVSTSSAPVIGNIPYWTGNGYPATLGTVATSTLTGNYPISISNSPMIIGASGAVVSFPATSTLYGTGSNGQVLMWSGSPTWTTTTSLSTIGSGTNGQIAYWTGANTLSSLSSSTIYGTGSNGQVLMWSGSAPVWTATNTPVVSLTANYPLSVNANTGAVTISTVATSSLALTTSAFASPNISQWTNNSGYWNLASATIPVSAGGTGAITLSGLVLGNGTAAMTATSVVAVNYGGSGANTLTGLLLGNGTSPFTGTTTVATNYGGTGITTTPSYGQLLMGNTTNTYTPTATTSLGIWRPAYGGTGSTTLSGILWGNGTNSVNSTGTVAVNFGGTGSTTLSGILKGNGTGGIQSALVGTDYQAAGSYQTLDSDLTTIAGLTVAKGDVMIGSASPAWTNLAVGTNGYVLMASTTATNGLSWMATSTLGISGAGGVTSLTANYPLSVDTGTGAVTISTVATSSLSLLVGSFASSNISQWTNNSGYWNLASATIPVANGGTGAITLSGIVFGNGTAALTTTTTVAVNYGGTGITTTPTYGQMLVGNGTTYTLTATTSLGLITGSGTTGDLAYFSGVKALSSTSTLATNKGGTGIATTPAYGQLLLGNSTNTYTLSATTSLGVFGVTNGGTGAATLSGVLFGNGTAAVTTTTTLAVNYGGTGATTLTGFHLGNGSAVTTGSSTIAVNYGGTGATTITGFVLAAGTSAMTGSTTIATNYGGTGITSTPSYGQILVGNGTTYTLTATSSLGLLGSGLTKGYFLVGSDGNVAQATSTIFISSTGQVGIGSSTPYSELTIQASSGNTSNILTVASSTGANLFSIDSDGHFLSSPTASSSAAFTINNNLGNTVFNIDTTVTSMTSKLFQVATTTPASNYFFAVMGNGHLAASSTVPVVSSCGTSPSITGSDSAFTVTVGSVAATTCTVTFAYPFTNVPVCTVTGQTGTIALTYSKTASAITITNAALTGDIIDVLCVGNHE